jgi:hypothetical protein
MAMEAKALTSLIIALHVNVDTEVGWYLLALASLFTHTAVYILYPM